MLDCDDVLKKVFDFLDHEVDAAGVAELEEHLDLCRTCFDRVEFEKRLRERMREKTFHACPDALKNRIQGLLDTY